MSSLLLFLKKNASFGMVQFVFFGIVWKSEIIYLSEIAYL